MQRLVLRDQATTRSPQNGYHSFVVVQEGMSSDKLLRRVLEEDLVQRPW